jgi:hypothetical protein
MSLSKHRVRRVHVLVKAFPQHSAKYEETVCCAGVVDDGSLIRLYPIAFRRLALPHRFTRFDQIEALITRAGSDPRPESFHVDHDSIRVVEHGSNLPDAAKVRLWQPHIVPSLEDLLSQYQSNGRSLGIVRPDPGSARFFWRDAEPEEQDDSRGVQASFLDTPLQPLQPPELTFFYRYTSAGKEHTQAIHDWEVQAAYLAYQRQYGSRDEALKMMAHEYGTNMLTRNLHFIMGNMHKRPWQFIIIGLLRSGLDPAELSKQGALL